jgi:hypothetical protein
MFSAKNAEGASNMVKSHCALRAGEKNTVVA